MPRQINPNLKHLVSSFKSDNSGSVLEGSSRCFHEDQLIITDEGFKKIKHILPGDLVLSRNHELGKDQYKHVHSCTFQPNKKKCFKIKLKDGTIIKCTEDHKFFYKGRYIEIKNIVSLWKRKYESKDND